MATAADSTAAEGATPARPLIAVSSMVPSGAPIASVGDRPPSGYLDVLRTRRPSRLRRAKTPNCTHIDMDRVYGRDQFCGVCGRAPSLGFLYVCRQDLNPWPPVVYQDAGTLNPQEMHGAEPPSELRRSLEQLQLSEAVIATAERGEYTQQQLAKLKQQKLELKQTIDAALQNARTDSMFTKLGAFLSPSSDGSASSLHADDTVPIPTCQFRACHTCRPYYKDRIYASITSVTSNMQPPFSEADIHELHLPTKDARKLRHIGLLPSPAPRLSTETPSLDTATASTPSLTPTSNGVKSSFDNILAASTHDPNGTRDSILTWRTTQTDIEDLARVHSSPRRRFYELGHRSSNSVVHSTSSSPVRGAKSIRSAFKSLFKNGKDEAVEPPDHDALPAVEGQINLAGSQNDAEDGERLSYSPNKRIRRQKDQSDLRRDQSIPIAVHVPTRALSTNASESTSLTLSSPTLSSRPSKVSLKERFCPRAARARGMGRSLDSTTETSMNGSPGTHFRATMSASSPSKRKACSTSSLPPRTRETDHSQNHDQGSEYALSSGSDADAGSGSEVEVSGGVALTEEAVEMSVPDILDTSTTSDGVVVVLSPEMDIGPEMVVAEKGMEE